MIWKHTLAHGLFCLGVVKTLQNNSVEARACFEEVLKRCIDSDDHATCKILAGALLNIIPYYSSNENQIDSLLEKLRDLAADHDDPSIREKLSMALHNAMNFSSSVSRNDNLLQELRNLSNEHDESILKEILARALMSTILHLSDTTRIDALLEELRDLVAKDDKQALREALAGALRNATVPSSDATRLDVLLQELRNLVAEHDELAIAEQLAGALSNAIYHSQDVSRIDHLLQELINFASTYDIPVVRNSLSQALFHAFNNTNAAGNIDAAQRYLNELRDLYSKYGEPAIKDQFAWALTNATAHSSDIARSASLLQELRDLTYANDEPSTIEQLAKALSNAIKQLSDATQVDNLLGELRELSAKHNESSIRQALASALTNAIARSSDINRIDTLLKELRNIATTQDEPAIRQAFALGLFNQGLKGLRAKDDEDRTLDAFRESVEFLSRFPGEEQQEQLRRAFDQYDRLRQKLSKPIETSLVDIVPSLRRTILKNSLKHVIEAFKPEEDEFMTKMDASKQRIDNFLRKESLFAPDASVLLVLRQWNSFTPIIADGQEFDRGGGYFIFHHGQGLVIDPGYNFIELFYQAGGRIHDITHIAVTHAHDDHTAQLEQLFTMFHQYNRKVGDRKKVTLLLNHSTMKKFSGFSLLRDCAYIDHIICLNRFDDANPQRITLAGAPPLVLTVLPAYHDDIFSTDYAVGLGISSGKGDTARRLIFTGDSGLFPPKIANGKVEKYLTGKYQGVKKVREDEQDTALHKRYPTPFDRAPHLLVPHIGSIKEYEFDPQDLPEPMAMVTSTAPLPAGAPAAASGPRVEESPMFYPNHLGLLGTATLIQELAPEAVILSEFGAELKDLRMSIMELLDKALRQSSPDGTSQPFIVPGDRTIVYNIADGTFLCHDDGMFRVPAEIDIREVDAKGFDGLMVGLFQKSNTRNSLSQFFEQLRRLRKEPGATDTGPVLPHMKKSKA